VKVAEAFFLLNPVRIWPLLPVPLTKGHTNYRWPVATYRNNALNFPPCLSP